MSSLFKPLALSLPAPCPLSSSPLSSLFLPWPSLCSCPWSSVPGPPHLAGPLNEPPHHLFNVGSILSGRVRVHGHAGQTFEHPPAGPADVQRRHLRVRHVGPVGGVDPRVRVAAGGCLLRAAAALLVLLSGLELSERARQHFDFPGG